MPCPQIHASDRPALATNSHSLPNRGPMLTLGITALVAYGIGRGAPIRRVRQRLQRYVDRSVFGPEKLTQAQVIRVFAAICLADPLHAWRSWWHRNDPPRPGVDPASLFTTSRRD